MLIYKTWVNKIIKSRTIGVKILPQYKLIWKDDYNFIYLYIYGYFLVVSVVLMQEKEKKMKRLHAYQNENQITRVIIKCDCIIL